MDYFHLIKEYLSAIKPSQYGYILPLYDRSELDKLAQEGEFPALDGLANSLIVATVLGFARYLLTYILIKPLAVSALKLKFHTQAFNPVLEGFRKNTTGCVKKIKSDDIKKFCAEHNKNNTPEKNILVSEAQEYLWNVRHNDVNEQKVVKFVEAVWRLLFYVYFCWVGYSALFVGGTAVWILDTKEHWIGWPLQPISNAIDYYYQVELGAYIHQLLWTEVSRSDSVEMIIHHLATILLIVFSYLTNFTRIGASIILLHDSSDVFLESAKVFVYISKTKHGKWASKYCDTLFALFAVSFFIGRLIIYPRFLIYSLIYEAPAILGGWPGHGLFSGLLMVLQFLHIFWFYLILRMIPALVSTGIKEDVRSDDEGDIDGYQKEKKSDSPINIEKKKS